MTANPSTDTRCTLHLDEVRDLFVAPDPAPFSEHPNYESGIEQIWRVVRPRNLRRGGLQTTVYVQSGENGPLLDETRAALRRYCDSRIEAEHSYIAFYRREGFIKLLIGVVFLLATLGVKAILNEFDFEPELVHTFLDQGLTVISWVVLWTPLSLLIFDWWHHRVNADAYRAIRDMELELVTAGTASEQPTDPQDR